MRHLFDRPTHGWCVGSLDDLIQLPQTQSPYDPFVFVGTSNRAAVILNPDLRRRRFLFALSDHDSKLKT
jgi:hypothetical protein